jgi:two-component system phosphate regulon sensor histidine kinase PhoR
VVLVLHDVSELRRLENLRHEFVANVSHELKTPLAAIKAYAETLRLGAVNDRENNLGFVVRIEEQADRLHQLILDTLQIARVESGREAFDIANIPVAGAVDACVAQLAGEAQLKNITLRIQPPVQPLSVRADEDGLRTILENLVDNAIKYTPENGEVVLRWWPENSSVVLEVRDTGIGIAAKDQGRIFERFFRVDQARSRELGGTGLGLSIVKHLAQAFGGSVSLMSELGKGSRFLVRIPGA